MEEEVDREREKKKTAGEKEKQKFDGLHCPGNEDGREKYYTCRKDETETEKEREN